MEDYPVKTAGWFEGFTWQVLDGTQVGEQYRTIDPALLSLETRPSYASLSMSKLEEPMHPHQSPWTAGSRQLEPLPEPPVHFSLELSSVDTPQRRPRPSPRWGSDVSGHVAPQRIPSEPYINASLGGQDMSTFPDTGAAGNFLSLSYAQRRGLAVNRTSSSHIRVGNGKVVETLGTTSLPFTFTGEKTAYELVFNVIPKSIHDVIIGSHFLRSTETFTRYAHRVGRKLRDALAKRICILGSQQYVSGLANGVFVDAIPDTGADVCCMSASFAKAQAFHIDASEEHRIPLEFADGTTGITTGMVRDMPWMFGGTHEEYHANVYVLPDLPADIVLSYDFLCSTDAFVTHESSFWYDEDQDQSDTWCLSVIRIASKLIKGSKSAFSATPNIASDPEEVWRNRKPAELEAYRNGKKHAHDLPDHERAAHLAQCESRWQQFLESRPGYEFPSQGTPPQTPPSTTGSSQTSYPVAAIPPTSRPSIFDKFRRSKQKARQTPPGLSMVI